jgi:hypothetical protein
MSVYSGEKTFVPMLCWLLGSKPTSWLGPAWDIGGAPGSWEMATFEDHRCIYDRQHRFVYDVQIHVDI